MERLKTRIIVNPFSGTSSKEDFEFLLQSRIDQHRFDYEICYTTRAGHATTLSEEAKNSGFQVIVAVGGDGTVNEIANPLIGSDVILGILPGGSGNGFAMHLGLGRDTIKAIDALNKLHIIRVDTCEVNDQNFVNVSGIGFDARVAYLTKTNKKRGFWQYFLTTIREANKFEPTKMTIEGSFGKMTGRFAAVAVANASMYGYNFTIAPTAALDDGLLDIMLIKESSILDYALLAPRFLNKTLHQSRIVESYQTDHVRITLEKEDYFHIDGEGFQAPRQLDFRIHPKSLSVIGVKP